MAQHSAKDAAVDSVADGGYYGEGDEEDNVETEHNHRQPV